MSKLSKAQAARHLEACEVLKQDVLSLDEKWFVLENWREDATHMNTAAGAFFTPPELARSFTLEVDGARIIDLCAGIGTLSFLVKEMRALSGAPEITCVEINPDYVAVGRKLLPEARWVQASVFDLPNLGRFDFAIGNPPFGAINREGKNAPRFRGRQFEYHVIDIASDIADHGTFIIPQGSAPFRYSGEPEYTAAAGDGYRAFSSRTGIVLGPSCGLDCSETQDQWHGVAPKVEIVLADFTDARTRRQPAQASFLPEAAE